MKSVVFVANSTWCVYNFRLNLMTAFLEEGCTVHVIAPLDPTYDNGACIEGFRKMGVRFHALPLQPRGLNPFRELASIHALYKVLARIQPDIVLSYTVKCNLYAGICRRFVGFRQLANVPGLGEVFERRSVLSFVVSCLYRFVFRGMDLAFFQNREDLKYCEERRLVPPERCVVIPGSGVDLARFRPVYPPISGTPRTFLMFGRVLPQKGYAEYVDAARALRASFGDRVQCWVMGIEDKNRPDSSRLYATLQEAHDEGVIKLITPRMDVTPILEEVDTVVLPSRYNEGIPRSLLEALACGKIIITTDWRGCRETVEHQKNGFLIPVDDADALQDAMRTVVEMEDAFLAKMGRHSRAIVERSFDEEIVLNAYLDRALGERAPRRSIARASAQIGAIALDQEVGLSFGE